MKQFLLLFTLLATIGLFGEEPAIFESFLQSNVMTAKLFRPDTSEPRPAIIVLGGSEGGFNQRPAQLFAENGYVALALAYFQAEGVPENLENIPLEYFLNAIHCLKKMPFVKEGKVHLYGPSKGGELVLLLASQFPDEIASAIAIVPSCVTYGGINNHLESSWSLNGRAFPIAPTPGKKDVLKQLQYRETVELRELFLKKMDEKEAFEKAFIPVERISCPLLLISAGDDRMWPSSLYANLVMERLNAFHSPIFREHLSYELAGHMITNPNDPVIVGSFRHPVTGILYEMGGEAEAQAAACNDSWKRIISFLKENQKNAFSD
ncbi:MAG: hypothetical protein H0V82_06130 [Candidatus Protochlamydia sp.]|nr:hypothetical protein [Candidatus Protochlamydia sp.]